MNMSLNWSLKLATNVLVTKEIGLYIGL